MGSKEFGKFYNLVANHILDVNYQVSTLKEAILYQIFADKLHVLCVGHPSVGAKSFFRRSLEKICPSFNYIFIGGHQTKVGLSETITMMSEGLLMLDEICKASGADRTLLYDVLQFQILKIDKHDYHKLLPAKVNILGIGNPKPHGHWRSYGNIEMMKVQIPVDAALLRRFHVNIFMEDYTPEEFDQINRFKENRIHNPYVSNEDAMWYQNEVVERRNLNPTGKVPEKIFNFLMNMKKFDGMIVTPVTPELFEGMVEMAKARARIRSSETINKSDWNGTLNFYIKCLRTSGLTNKLIVSKLVKGKE